jgi:hypothetical protein
VRYEASSPHFNVMAPPGWSFESYADSPHAVVWFATDPAFAIPPGSTLNGFSYQAENVVPIPVLFSFGDDAGGGPLVADGFFVIGAGDSLASRPAPMASIGGVVALALLLATLAFVGLRRRMALHSARDRVPPVML